MKLTGGLIIIGWATVFGLLLACATHPPSVAAPCQPQKTYQSPPTGEDIIKDAQRVKSLSALVEITFLQGSPGKIRGLLVYQPPDLLRFEALSPWGQPSAYFIIKGQQLYYFNFGDNRLVIGSTESSLMKEFLGLELPPLWLFSLLNGRGWIAGGIPRFLEMEEVNGGREFYLQYPEQAFKEIIFWDSAAGEVKQIYFLNTRDGLRIRAQMEGSLCSRDISFPQKINLSSPSGWQAQMTFTQLQINHPVDPTLFEVPTPQEGMKVYNLK